MKRPKKVRFNKTDRAQTEKARLRVLKAARRKGHVTNAEARELGKWDQAWYHLDSMRRAGLLKKGKFNEWRPR